MNYGYGNRIPGEYIYEKNSYLQCKKHSIDNNNQITRPCNDTEQMKKHNSSYLDNNTEITRACNDEPMKKHNITIQKVESEMLTQFEQQFGRSFANKIFLAFDKVITEEKFEEIELISDDLEDPTISSILDSMLEDLDQHFKDPINDKIKITKTLLDIINSKYTTFNIKNWTFVVNQHDVNKATKKAQTEASLIFGHPTKGKMNIIIAEDKSLCIAKAVDMKNGFPITKWLLEVFSRYRLLEHKKLYEQFKGQFDEYKFASDKYATGYNPTTWWLRDSVFCKYIQYKNAKMALPLMTAVQALSKRVLPQLNFNPQSAHVIHDNLNDFAKYTLASWSLAHRLTQEREAAEMKCDGIKSNYQTTQIDCWIIPQLVKPRKLASLFNLEEIFDDEDELFRAENDNLLSELNLNFMNNYSDSICNKLGKVSMNKVKCPLWDLEQYLQQAGYMQNEDYWVGYADVDLDKIQDQFYRMLEVAKDERNIERCIFIIDRRNADNLKQKNMGLKKPNYSKGITKDFADKIYLIVPKQKTSFGMDAKLMPEIYWCRSKELLFPSDGERCEPIGILDDLNGYKFVVSYHLNESNSSSAYWYSDAGSVKFELQDMEWLFNRYFNKINDEEQTLTDMNCASLKKWMEEKPLTDVGFDNFWRQSHAMVLVYDNK